MRGLATALVVLLRGASFARAKQAFCSDAATYTLISPQADATGDALVVSFGATTSGTACSIFQYSLAPEGPDTGSSTIKGNYFITSNAPLTIYSFSLDVPGGAYILRTQLVDSTYQSATRATVRSVEFRKPCTDANIDLQIDAPAEGERVVAFANDNRADAPPVTFSYLTYTTCTNAVLTIEARTSFPPINVGIDHGDGTATRTSTAFRPYYTIGPGKVTYALQFEPSAATTPQRRTFDYAYPGSCFSGQGAAASISAPSPGQRFSDTQTPPIVVALVVTDPDYAPECTEARISFDGGPVHTVPVGADGRATFAAGDYAAPLEAGAHTVTAYLAGDYDYRTAPAQVKFLIDPASPAASGARRRRARRARRAVARRQRAAASDDGGLLAEGRRSRLHVV